MNDTKYLIQCILCVLCALHGHVLAEYAFSPEPVDVIIPCTHKDLPILEKAISGIRDNCKEVRRVIVISAEKFTDNAEWFDESHYPFSKEDIAYYLVKKNPELASNYLLEAGSRVGWYFQQLLKMYAPFVIPNISQNVLCLDSDTIFLNPVTFTGSENAGLYSFGKEYHKPYFSHIDKLTKGQTKRIYPKYSGISHHMLFQKTVLNDLFSMVLTIHQQEFWKAFCLCVDPADLRESGASEYELYFNYVFSKSNKVEVRPLKWINVTNLKKLKKLKKKGYHYVSCHSFWRDKK